MDNNKSNKKTIEQTLKDKIDANDQKIQSLFNFKLNEVKTPNEGNTNSIEESEEQIKSYQLRSLEGTSQKEKSEYNNNNPETKSNNNSESISISTKNNEYILSSGNKFYKKDTRNIKNIKKLQYNNSNIPIRKNNKINEKYNTINYNYNYNYNNYHNNNYNYNFNFNNKNKKISHKPKIKIKTNNNNNYYNYNCITDTSKFRPIFYHVNSKPNVNFDQMYERFEENQRRKKEKIQKLKLIQEEKVLEQCSHQPIINKSNRTMGNIIKDDFFTRQKKFKERKKQKGEKLKEILLKNEQNKINQNNYLLQRRNKKNLRIGSVDNLIENNNDSQIYCITRTKSQIENRINKLYEWDQRRKEKIERIREEEKYEDEKNDHIPKIDKRSSSLAHEKKNRNGEDIFERLSKEDKIIKEKRKLIAQITSPTFIPNSNINKNYKFKYKYNDTSEDKCFGTTTNCNNNEDDEDDDIDEIIPSSRNKKKWDEDEDILGKEMANIEDEKIAKMFRNAIFGKNKIRKLTINSIDKSKYRKNNIYN